MPPDNTIGMFLGLAMLALVFIMIGSYGALSRMLTASLDAAGAGAEDLRFVRLDGTHAAYCNTGPLLASRQREDDPLD